MMHTTVYRHALELCFKDGSYLTSMSCLVSALWYRYHRKGSTIDLEEAISNSWGHESLVSLRPTSDSDHSISLFDLGFRLENRLHRTGSMFDLEERTVNHYPSVTVPHLIKPFFITCHPCKCTSAST